MGASGSVAWMFNQCGQFIFEASAYTEEQMMDAALEAGAQDVRLEGERWVMTSEATDFNTVLESIEGAGLAYLEAEFTMVPENTISVTGKEAQQVIRLMEKLEDLDDVMKVHANFEIDDAEMEQILNG